MPCSVVEHASDRGGFPDRPIEAVLGDVDTCTLGHDMFLDDNELGLLDTGSWAQATVRVFVGAVERRPVLVNGLHFVGPRRLRSADSG